MVGVRKGGQIPPPKKPRIRPNLVQQLYLAPTRDEKNLLIRRISGNLWRYERDITRLVAEGLAQRDEDGVTFFLKKGDRLTLLGASNRPGLPVSASIERDRIGDRWRERIRRRDGDECRVCKSTERPEVAHITAVADFVRLRFRFRHLRGNQLTRMSFRRDNLFVLCRACHAAYDGRVLFDDPHLPRAVGRNFWMLVEANQVDRMKRIMPLVRRIQRDRGWRTPEELVAVGRHGNRI